LFAPESLVVMSWTLGSTQCSNIRMFIVEEVVDWKDEILNVVKGKTTKEDSMDDKKVDSYNWPGRFCSSEIPLFVVLVEGFVIKARCTRTGT